MRRHFYFCLCFSVSFHHNPRKTKYRSQSHKCLPSLPHTVKRAATPPAPSPAPPLSKSCDCTPTLPPTGLFPKRCGGCGGEVEQGDGTLQSALFSLPPSLLPLSEDNPLSTPNPPRNISLIAFNHRILAPKRFQFIKGTQIFRPAASWRLAEDKVETDRLCVCVCVCV